MNQINNVQGITKIIMSPIAYTKCKLGQDWYENKLTVEFIPDSYYPDYTEVTNWLMKNIDGQELNIEDVVDNLYQFLSVNYCPKHLKITDCITNCKTHFDVIVEK